MATVRFSAELKQQILDAASNKMRPAILRASDQRPSHDWGLRIYETIFREDVAAVRQVSAHWFDTVGALKIETVNGVHCGMEFNLPAPMPWPAVFPNTTVAQRRSSYGNDIAVTHDLFIDLANELMRCNAAITEARKRQTEFREMVSKVIDAYATLAPALKAWPPLWELVPEPVKERHREVKERASKTVDLNVDLSKLTALSTAAKFGV